MVEVRLAAAAVAELITDVPCRRLLLYMKLNGDLALFTDLESTYHTSRRTNQLLQRPHRTQ